MPTPQITTVSSLISSVQVSEVLSIVVTPVVSDGNGGFVRAIRVYGSPDGTNGLPAFTLLLSADLSQSINIHTGDLSF